MTTSTLLIVAVALVGMFASTSTAAIIQEGRRFPLGIQVGGNASCSTSEDDGLLRFENSTFEFCSAGQWHPLTEADLSELNGDLQQLRLRIEALENSNLTGSGSLFETNELLRQLVNGSSYEGRIRGAEVCSFHGIYNAQSLQCDCECSPSRGCWSALTGCTQCMSGWIGEFCNVDDEAPVLTLLGDNPFTMEAGDAYNEPGYTAVDAYDGDLTSEVATDADGLDVQAVGVHSVSYTVSDAANFQATANRDVEIVDTTPPVLTPVGGSLTITVEAGSSSVPEVDVIENSNGAVVLSSDLSTVLDADVVGTYTVTFQGEDASGNVADNVTITYVVVDTTAPVITLIGDNPLSVLKNSVFNDPGYTVTDNAQGQSLVVNVAGTVDTSTPGTYNLTYTCTDASGNDAVPVVRTVVVPDVVCSESVVEYYTPGTHTYTVPSSATALDVVVVGAGGGGDQGAGGGGGGAASKNFATVTPGTAYAVVVGSGGQSGRGGYSSSGGCSGNPPSRSATDGTMSSFNVQGESVSFYAEGGGRGTSYQHGGYGGQGYGGDLNGSGGNGGMYSASSAGSNGVNGGAGGGGYTGKGGDGSGYAGGGGGRSIAGAGGELGGYSGGVGSGNGAGPNGGSGVQPTGICGKSGGAGGGSFGGGGSSSNTGGEGGYGGGGYVRIAQTLCV